ncbi:transglutaminaseTgpA domain-containing protein [Mycetocola zhadangensis]|uniref:Transglutaminase domain-containing protein n=1 Tax=Mycetocola zhadangensis TaxID=1164595 RepID=A0A3L7IYP2_9MICO|nr:transglutaminase domain-containing protein [Mycetocola zhadangensis]RLQ82541.1 transglutaminase domain-containing protein [Mycetocola zhadangensis]GGF00427.1 cysteine protease [Mycetocola zhadangensis]
MNERTDATRFVIWNALFTILAVGVASALWWPIYQVSQFVILTVAAMVLGVLIAILGWRLRLPGFALLGITIGVYLVVGVPLALPDAALFGVLPTGPGLLDLITGTAESWKQLVTILLPVGAYQSLLIPPLVSILCITVITLSIALRTRRPEMAVVWPMLLAVLGIAFGPEIGWQSIALGLAVPVVALVWLVWLGRSRHRARQRRHANTLASVSPSRRERHRAAVVSVVSATLIVAVATCGGAVMASVVPASADRQVIRSHIEQPFNPRAYPSPLSGFRSFHLPDAAAEEMLTVSGLPADGRLRLATLDVYDGVVYTVGTEEISAESGTFVRVPYRLDQQASGQLVSLDVTISGYSGIWLPGAGHLRSIDFDGPNASELADSFFYNDVTGSSAVVNGLADGDSYRMNSVVAETPSVEELADVRPGSASAAPPVDLPGVMSERLDLYTDGVTGAGERLVAMLDGLKSDGYISHGVGENEPTSLSGHGMDRITALFTERPMVGDEEQYAVAAALMARELGFPSRVVMGFLPTPNPSTGTATVLSNDISAWIEVQADDGTWLTVDTTPPLREIPEKELDEPTKVSRPQSVVQPPVEEEEPDTEQLPADDTVDNDDQPLDPLLALLLLVAQILGWSLLALAVLASPFLAVMAAKARRRVLRRSRRTPAERIRAGWQEFQDSAVDYGIEPPPSATRREVASTVGGKRAFALASVADRATFSTERPSNEDADRVWVAVDDLRKSLGSKRTRRERLRAATSLRSLGIRPRRSK